MRGAVLRSLGAVGGEPLGSASEAALLVALSSPDAVTQHVKTGSVPVGGDAIRHVFAFRG
jgi:hypothetical protein